MTEMCIRDRNNLYCEVNENIKAYGVASHRHTPEIEEQLSYACGRDVVLSFTPHLVPMNRGILVTAYANLLPGVSEEQIRNAYETQYKGEPFIRLLAGKTPPETRWVEGSNYVDINLSLIHISGPGGDSHKQYQYQIEQRVAGAHSGQRAVSHVFPDHDGIHRIVKLLGQITHQQRNRELHQTGCRASCCHILRAHEFFQFKCHNSSLLPYFLYLPPVRQP